MEYFFLNRKYVLDLLQETELLSCKPMCIPMDTDAALWEETGPLFEDVSHY